MDQITNQITRIENKIDAVDEKFDYVVEDLHEMKITAISQHGILQEHIRRTELNEQAITLLKEQVEPMAKDRLMISGAIKLLSAMVGAAAVIDVILRLFFHR